jgi:calcineurin-like phosphoesterase family protein
MLSHQELDRTWQAALRAHAKTPLQGEKGPYMPIGAKSMALLDPLWKGRVGQELDLGAMLAKGQDVRAFGDPHFEHANIIHMCERPFENIEAMDQAMWESLERAHSQADFVLCVGDFAMKNPIAWQRKISTAFSGKHATTVGNHDAKGAKPDQWLAAGAWASLAFSVSKELVASWVARHEPEVVDALDWDALPRFISVGVSHWPVPPERLPGPGWINLHGHIHNRPNRPLRVNCSMEAIGFEPRPIERLIDARVVDDLIRRQKGLGAFDESATRDQGDASYL